jgi:phosphoribosylformimino-5-aminoimidazole carboxamide ribotide isomerase
MQLYPAIDLKGGRVVRWLEGESVHETVYGDDPLEQAESFVADGATWVHVVDMDKAFQTGADNLDWIRRIAALRGLRVQVGGNVDSETWAREALEAGASRVVLGTVAVLDGSQFRRLVQLVGSSRCAVAVDVRDGRPALRGLNSPVEQSTQDLVARAMDAGVQTIVYRDLARDGLVTGVDLNGATLIAARGAQVIVAGGVAGLDDVREAARRDLAGVIVGRALYEGRFTLREAIECSQ